MGNTECRLGELIEDFQQKVSLKSLQTEIYPSAFTWELSLSLSLSQHIFQSGLKTGHTDTYCHIIILKSIEIVHYIAEL